MAGDIKVAVVSGPISSSGTGTADFIKTDFGTPKACIVLLSFDPTDDASVQAEGKASIGFSDFTNHRCITHQDEDGSGKVDSDARKSNTKAYVVLTVAGAVDIDGAASTIADGVRLTNTTNGSASAVFATVIMFGGADLQVSLDSVSLGNGTDLTTVTTTGIPQDLVFFIGTDISGEDSSSTGIENSFGVVDISNDQATIVNRCMGWASDHNNNVGSPSAVVRNDRCLKVLTEAGADDWGVELTAATATSYTVTTRDVTPGAGMEVYALALDLDNRGSKVGSVDSPISGATWTPSVSLGFTPQYVGLGLNHTAVEGTIETDADAGGLGISSNTGSGEEACLSWYNEDAALVTNTNNLFRSRVIDFRDHIATTVVQDHSHSSFNSGGWTYTINVENEVTAKKWFYWAIEEAAAAGLTEVITEAVGITDDTVVKQDKVVEESVGISDVVSRVHLAERIRVEPVGITDETNVAQGKEVVEDVGVTELVESKLTKQRPVTESVGLTDTVLPVKTIRITIVESIGITDAPSRITDTKRVVTDDVGVTDETPVKQSKEIVEAVGVGDVILDDLTAGGLTEVITEDVGIGDVVLPAKSSARTVTEPIGIGDVVLPAKTIRVEIVESIGVADVISKAVGIEIAEAVGISDTTSRIIDWKRIIAETLGLTDLTTRDIDYVRTVVEAVGLSDTIIPFLPTAGVLELQALAVGRALDRIAVGQATSAIAVKAPK